jgi:hypothetical protein
MSTKNLARTVIEGGRADFNRWARRFTNARERCAERLTSAALARGEDPDAAVYRPREPLGRSFRDKLAPAERWLDKQVGRPWNKVRGELFARFDTRTTAGRHILFDHLLADVDLGDFAHFGLRFTVDSHGLLKRAPKRPRPRRQFEPLPEPASVLSDWIAGRRVGERGTRCYWFVPTEAGFFRQDRELSALEVGRFRALPKRCRLELAALIVSPNH